MQFGICNEIFLGWNLKDAMRFARETGYDAIEIAPYTLAPNVNEIPAKRRREIRAEAESIGIRISGIHWVLVQTEGLHLTHPDSVVRQRTARYFMDLVDFCADIGGSTVVVGSPKQRSLMEGVEMTQAVAWSTDVFRGAVRRGEEREVTICLEPLAPSETNFVNTAAEAIQFIGGLPSPRFKIILDVKAMDSETMPIPEIIRTSWPHFAYFHANDRNLKGPGFGDVDFIPIAQALLDVGYQGMVSVEVFKFDEGPEHIARASLDYLRRTFQKARLERR